MIFLSALYRLQVDSQIVAPLTPSFDHLRLMAETKEVNQFLPVFGYECACSKGNCHPDIIETPATCGLPAYCRPTAYPCLTGLDAELTAAQATDRSEQASQGTGVLGVAIITLGEHLTSVLPALRKK